MPTVYDLGGLDDCDRGDPAASDPIVVRWDDRHSGHQLYLFRDLAELREQVRKLARLN